jgi:hypothetical protein
MIWVNATWLISLVLRLSLTSALCSFFGGLGMIFHAINTKVAIAADVPSDFLVYYTPPFLSLTSGARIAR